MDFANTTTAIRNSFRIVTAAISGVASALSAPLSQFSRYEDAATRLSPLVGGLGEAKRMVDALRASAADGTLSLEQLTSVAARLSSVFRSNDAVMKWTRAFHDVAAGTGLDVNELVGNFVKSKASGRVEAGFLDMFAQKGVNIYEPLAKELKLSEAELRRLASTGELSFAQIERAILACATGTGKFAGAASKMSGTFSGSVATMKENWNILLSKIGEPFADFLTPKIQWISVFLAENKSAAESFGRAALNASEALGIMAGALVAAKVAMAAFSAATAASPIGFAVAAFGLLATAAYAAYGAMQDTSEKYSEFLDRENRKVDELRASYAALNDVASVRERAVQDRKALEKEGMLYQNYDAEKAQWAVWGRKYLDDGKAGFFNSEDKVARVYGFEDVDDMSYWARRKAMHDSWQARVKELSALEKQRVAEIEAASAAERSAAAKKESLAAQERLAALEKDFAKKEADSGFADLDPRSRAKALVESGGFADAAALESAIAGRREALSLAAEQGVLTRADVEAWRELVELRDKANAASREAEREASAARDRLASADEEYAATVLRLEAELTGEKRIIDAVREKARLEQLSAQYAAAGVNAAEARARAERIVALEREKAEKNDGGTYDRELAKSYEARGYSSELAKKTAQAIAAWRGDDADAAAARRFRLASAGIDVYGTGAEQGGSGAASPAGAGTVSEKEKVPEPSLSDAAAKPQGGVLDFTAGLAALARSQLEELKAIRKAAETIAKDDSPSAALIG